MGIILKNPLIFLLTQQNTGTQQVTVAGQSVMIGGDIIIALNEIRITGIDNLSTFLEEQTLPDQIIDVTIVRDGQTITLTLELDARPSLT